MGALACAALIVWTSGYVWSRYAEAHGISRPAAVIVVLLILQVGLGAVTVLSRRDVIANSAHVVFGALVLAASLVVTLRSWRSRFPTIDEPVTSSDTPEMQSSAQPGPISSISRSAAAPGHLARQDGTSEVGA